MPEGSGVEMSPQNIQRNPVSEVNHYGELNAPTLQAADEKFTQKLISSLRGSTVSGEVNRGSQFLVNELADNNDIVVKRLRAGTRTDKQGDRTTDEYWNDLRKDHELAEKYFGRRFVPYTEFLVVDGTNFGDPHPNKFEVIPQKEYVMVQEKLAPEE